MSQTKSRSKDNKEKNESKEESKIKTPNSTKPKNRRTKSHNSKYFVQLIDGEGNFNASIDDLKDLIEHAVRESDIYSIVGIMGCQSSGKSTLLNLLFGTEFKEMDATSGRSQTTLGVWLDASSIINNVVVMDLEGTDSGERGEDRTPFERQTCMFAMAMAEILIVNMWEHDIGRYTASNYGILKTVFEVNMQLFKDRSKTVLLFIIRDYVKSRTPFEILRKKLDTELNKIWAELTKPEEFKDSQLGDFFSFEFCALPHKELQPNEFQNEVLDLRKRFVEKSRPDYIFNHSYHGKKAVPPDGFPHYSTSIWETIKSNKDLNLPSQKEMLATYRCDEISNQALNQFETDVKNLRQKVADAYVGDFSNEGKKLLDEALETYDKVATKYVSEIVSVKRQQLHSKISDELQVLFNQNMKHAAKYAHSSFSAELNKLIEEMEGPISKFFDIVHKLEKKAKEGFKKSFDESLVAGTTWEYGPLEKDLIGHIEETVDIQRKMQLEKVLDLAVNIAQQKVLPDILSHMKDPNEDMWHQIAKCFALALHDISGEVSKWIAELKANEQERTDMKLDVKQQINEMIRKEVRVQVENISLKMRSKFEKLFREDADGLPRRFGKNDDIRAIFKNARDRAIALLDLFAVYQLPVYDVTDEMGEMTTDAKDEKKEVKPADDPKNVFLTFEMKQQKEADFLRFADGALFEAESEQMRRKQEGRFPMWLIAIIVFLGFDEFMTLLRNPFLMMFVIMIGSVVAAIHFLNLWGPLKFLLERSGVNVPPFVEDILDSFGIRLNTNRSNNASNRSTSSEPEQTSTPPMNSTSSYSASTSPASSTKPKSPSNFKGESVSRTASKRAQKQNESKSRKN